VALKSNAELIGGQIIYRRVRFLHNAGPRSRSLELASSRQALPSSGWWWLAREGRLWNRATL